MRSPAGQPVQHPDRRRDAPQEVAVARARCDNGTWMVLHGAPLLMAAYGLAGREKDVCRLVLRGETTTVIAGRLFVSPQTVQQHLKSIFDKTGVRSRRDLVSRIFFTHYEPRVRDNERRAQAGRPFRGGPAAGR
jgi:DNA-binding CsgD family transcriptional regulator